MLKHARQMDSAIQSDTALSAALKAGDAAAFRTLAQTYGSALHGFAAKVLGNSAQAEDVVQEAMIKLWRRPELYDPAKAKFSTWMHRVVLNRCLDVKRRKVPVGLEQAPEPEPTAPDQEDGLHDAARRDTLTHALAQLPEHQRAAIALCYGEEMSQREAAAVLEMNLKALESLLTRARAKLKELLAAQKDELL